MEIEYFKKRSISVNYYGKITSHSPYYAILVIVGDSGFYGIEGTNLPIIDSEPATTQEFETAYNDAIKSFGPVPGVNNN